MDNISFFILIAFLFDLWLGDPEYRFHPVRLIGKLIFCFENLFLKFSKRHKLNGLFFFIFITGASVLTILIISKIAKNIDSRINIKIFYYSWNIYIIYSCLSLKDLKDKIMEIYDLLINNDISTCRKKLSYLVGRDTEKLNVEEMTRAAVETVSENIVDGILSPLFYAFIGGAPLAIFYKAVNTLDSMVGYKNDKYQDFGFFSAKLDDVFNFIPARLSALVIPLAFFIINRRGASSFISVLKDGQKHPSPNSGIPEAAVAGGLGVRLGGVSYYQGLKSEKPFIGRSENELQANNIKSAIKAAYLSSILFVCAGLLIRLIIL